MIEHKPNTPSLIALGILFLALIAAFLMLRPSPQPNIPVPTPTPIPMVKPTGYILISPPEIKTSSWKTHTDRSLNVSLQYPSSVMIDKRQTTEGRRVAFIAKEDKQTPLPGVPTLFLTGLPGTGMDGYDVFAKTDCPQPCTLLPQDLSWIQVNNVYGIKNPRPQDRGNYYLTDENKTGAIVNIYIGGLDKESDEKTEKKIETFDRMIRTLTFLR